MFNKTQNRTQAAATSVPVAHPIDYNRDGQTSGGNIVPAVDKLFQIIPKNSVLGQPWNNTLSQVELAYPKFLGKVTDSVLQMNITVTNTSASTGSVQLTPTTQWFSRLETMLAAQVLESVEPYEIHTESVSYCTDQEFNNVYQSMNLSSTAGFVPAFPLAAGASVTFTYYLPLWCTLFSTMQPFIRAFADEWRLRFTFQNSIVTTNGTLAAANTQVVLNSLYLWATEANISDAAAIGLEQAHRTGIVYRGIIRNKWTSNEVSIPSASPFNKILTSFNTDSAGLLVYAKANSTDPTLSLTTYPLDQLELRNASNSQLTQTLPATLIEAYIMPQQAPILSQIVNNPLYNIYLFPFCQNILHVLETGKNGGGYTLDAQTRVQFVPPATLSNVTVSVVSYEYCVVSVRGGVAQVERHA
jgi:hypothetical protein